MKNKYIVVIFLVASIIVILGALFKIIHIEIGVITGNYLLSIGMLTQIAAVILFLSKILSNKNNDFLNK